MAFTTVPAVTDGDFLIDDWGNSVAAAATELQRLRSGQTVSDGTPVAITMPGPTTVLSMIIPATGQPGRIHIWGTCSIDKSAAADGFNATIVEASTTRGVDFGTTQGQDPATLHPTGSFTTTGAGSHTVDMQVTRSSGAGSANTVESPTVAMSMHWIFVPS